MRISKKRADSSACWPAAGHAQTRIAKPEIKRLMSPGIDYRKYSACRAAPLLGLGDAVDLRSRPDDEAAAGDGRRGHAHFVERVLAEDPELRPGLHHEGVAVLAQGENLAVIRPRRSGKRRRFRIDALLAVYLAACPRLVTRHHAAVEQRVIEIAIYQRRWVVRSRLSLIPRDVFVAGLAFLEADVAPRRGPHREHRPHRIADVA